MPTIDRRSDRPPYRQIADNLRAAIERAGVTFPVAVDPDFRTWNAYGNRSWPAFYFIDRGGRVRHARFGEGDYERSEAVIRELLAELPRVETAATSGSSAPMEGPASGEAPASSAV